MDKDLNRAQFIKDKEITEDNLEALQMSLEKCVEQGMIDEDAHFYNELLELIEDLDLIKTDQELDELIAAAKIVETDIDVWFSVHGLNTVSLPWPKREKS